MAGDPKYDKDFRANIPRVQDATNYLKKWSPHRMADHIPRDLMEHLADKIMELEVEIIKMKRRIEIQRMTREAQSIRSQINKAKNANHKNNVTL
jgi:hypothetical protein